MKNNFKFLIILTILLAGCLCIGSTFAADLSVTNINDLSSVDDTQNMEIAHDDSSQNVEITKVSETPGTFKDLNTTINNAIASGNTSIVLDKNYKYVIADDELSEGITISTNNLIIDGNGITIDGSNLARVFTVKASDVVIKNINFINTKATDSDAGAIHGVYGSNNCIIHDCNFTNSSAPSGGAILWNGWNGTFYDCNFVNCSSTDYSWGGGAIFWSRNDGCISGCNFTDCTSNCYGGAVFLDGMAQSTGVADSIFTNCSAKNGGAIYLIMGNVSFSTFINCYADKGGSIFFLGSEHSTIAYSNFINSSARRGGSIYWDRTIGCIVRESNFTNSIAKYSYMGFNLGGAIYLNNTTSSTLNSSNFINCSAIDEGGAIYDTDSNDTKVISCNFTNDTADSGGAISLSMKKYVYIVNSTFDSCAATSDGGAIFLTDYKKIKCNVSSCNFTNCTADNKGSAIWICNNASLNISNSTCTPAEGDEKAPIYNEGNISSKVVITTLNGSNKLVSYGDIVNVTANVTTSGIPVAGGYVMFDINYLEKNGSSDEKGIYSVEYSIDFNGTKPVDATYYNCNGYQAVNAYYLTTTPIVLDINVSASGVYGENITGSINTTYDGNITLNINGTNCTGKVVNGTFVIPNTDNLNINNYTNVPVSFVSDDGVYIGNTIINFTIDKANGSFNISVEDISYGEYFIIYVTNASSFNDKKLNGTVTVTINGENYEVNIINGIGSKVISDILPVGDYLVNATLIIPNYNVIEANTSFAVNKAIPTVSVDTNNITYGDYAVVNVTVSGAGSAPTGNVTILVNGAEVANVTLSGGKCSYSIFNLNAGDYNITVIYNGDTNYASVENSTDLTVIPKEIDIAASLDNITYGDNVSGKVNAGMNGTVVIQVVPGSSSPIYIDVDESGEFSVPINLPAGGYENVSVSFISDDGNYVGRDSVSFTVAPKNITILTFVDNSVYGENLTGTLNASGKTGNISVTINGTVYNGTVDSEGKFILSNTDSLNAGYYKYIPVSFISDDGNYIGEDDCAFVISRKDMPINATINNITYGENLSGSVSADLPGMISIYPGEGTISYEFDTIGPFTTEWDEENILNVGNYTGHIIFLSDDGNYIGKINVSYNIAKADPNMLVNISSEWSYIIGKFYYYDWVIATANLPKDATGTVYFSIDNETWNPVNITDESSIDFVFKGLDAGDYVLFVKYDGDNNYNSDYSEIPFTINKLPTYVTVYPTTGPVKGKAGEKVTIHLRVRNILGNAVDDGSVNIVFNGKTYNVNLVDGYGTIDVVLPKAGTYSAIAYYGETNNYEGSSTVFTVEVSDIPGPNPNPTPINSDVGNMENTGNPLLVLLIALCAIGLESLRRKL